MRSALGGPRVLLRRLREVMAEQVSAQERLDKIVVLIAANMVAEVCSTYVLRVDNTLELYATEGLNRDAVHQTVLNAHEGLVGLVASEATPLNLSNAQSHPAFSSAMVPGMMRGHSTTMPPAAAGARRDRPLGLLGAATSFDERQEVAAPQALLEPAPPLSREDDATDRPTWP